MAKHLWRFSRLPEWTKAKNKKITKEKGRGTQCNRELLLNDMKVRCWTEIRAFQGNSFNSAAQNKSCVWPELLKSLKAGKNGTNRSWSVYLFSKKKIKFGVRGQQVERISLDIQTIWLPVIITAARLHRHRPLLVKIQLLFWDSHILGPTII